VGQTAVLRLLDSIAEYSGVGTDTAEAAGAEANGNGAETNYAGATCSGRKGMLWARLLVVPVLARKQGVRKHGVRRAMMLESLRLVRWLLSAPVHRQATVVPSRRHRHRGHYGYPRGSHQPVVDQET